MHGRGSVSLGVLNVHDQRHSSYGVLNLHDRESLYSTCMIWDDISARMAKATMTSDHITYVMWREGQL
jgi:hypothetical protein